MTNGPLVSVIIPTYERINLTLSAVGSVMKQDYDNFEVIVVDDGSTESVLSELKARLPANVLLLTLPHSGLPAVARNAGIEISKGEWIAFLDSDDIWYENKISCQMSVAIAENYDCVSANFDSDVSLTPSKTTNFNLTRFFLRTMLRRNQVVNSSVIVRKTALLEVGGVPALHNVRGVEDYATWLRLVSRFKWGHIHSSLGIYTTENFEAARISSKSNPFNHIYAIVDFVGWLRSQGKSLFGVRMLFKLLPLILR